jgi:ubiquinol-cytochrome c reductase cytochrome b subunit
VLSVILVFLTLGSLAYLGITSPWSPVMNAWSGLPLPAQALDGRTPLELAGAAVFQNKQCRNCHSVGGTGGARGPALDAVAARLTGDQLIRQVLQGGGNMPAYGKQLSPPEVTALVSWLTTLHPAYEARSRDASLAKPER